MKFTASEEILKIIFPGQDIMADFGYKKLFDLEPSELKKDDLILLASVMSRYPQLYDNRNFISRFIARMIEGVMSLFTVEIERIPAGYTYLAQFIGHDITFDAKSDRHVTTHLPFDDKEVKAEEIRNKRNPYFDLEAIYGHEKPHPNNEDEAPRCDLMQDSELPFLKLGYTEAEPFPNDLLRDKEPPFANVVDRRNDENLILAQTQVAFTKFHNAIVLELSQSDKYKLESGGFKKTELFNQARKLAIRFYQTIILEDFLPRFVRPEILADVRQKAGTQELFYQPKDNAMYIPLEFAVAVFRAGHSMIRDGYNLNKQFPLVSSGTTSISGASIEDILMQTGRGRFENNGKNVLSTKWLINWYNFYDIDGSAALSNKNFNFAEPINTQIVTGIQTLRPDDTAGDNEIKILKKSLSALDLFRGRKFRLASGKDVADQIAKRVTELNILGVDVISEIINKLVNAVPDWNTEKKESKENQLNTAFSKNPPLWFYVLAEAELQNDGKLGIVGSRILAETFIQLLNESEYSVLQTKWEDEEDEVREFFNKYKITNMAEMLKFVREMHKNYFDIIYPEGSDRKEYFKKYYPTKDFHFDELNPLG
ncbi:MAG TPA: peroxidase family protein [Pyrinomonadaceae bacterium]|nr:peroxidase family protein [Pyrinomonadaceae bacterium]